MKVSAATLAKRKARNQNIDLGIEIAIKHIEALTGRSGEHVRQNLLLDGLFMSASVFPEIHGLLKTINKM